MYSMDDLLYLVHSDGADALKIRVGVPPVIVLDGDEQPLEGPAISADEAERLFTSLANTRQRRSLRDQGCVEFIYKFRNRADFVVRAVMQGGVVKMDIH
jgi:Tfp pilus assembly ATPase PilU